jgi:hypothetical protein
MASREEVLSQTTNAPVPFVGTKEEVQANRESHRFMGDDDRCMFCDVKPWHVSADYPCGAEVPRANMPYGDYVLNVLRETCSTTNPEGEI